MEQKEDPKKIFFTQVPVTGFRNLYEAEGPRCRRFWTFILVLAAILIVVSTVITIIRAIDAGTVIEVRMFYDENQLPFPNISVCAPLIINGTYIRQRISIPADVNGWLNKGNRSEREFIENFSKYLAYSMRVKNLNDTDLKYFDRVYVTNFEMAENKSNRAFGSFYRESQPQCQQIVSDCQFDGVPFDCCQTAEFSMMEDSVCYRLSMASFNGTSVDREQRRLGPRAGIKFRATFDTREAMLIEDDHADGFRMHVDHVASYLNSPVVVPSGTSAALHLTAKSKTMMNSCLPKITNGQVKTLRTGVYYDPDGIRCKEERFINLMVMTMGCNFPFYPHFANYTSVCPPRTLYIMEKVINSNLSDEYDNGKRDVVNSIRNLIRDAYYTDQCLPACFDWDYEVTANYLPMTHSDHKSHFQDVPFSDIYIFYSQLSHSHYVQQLKYTPYTIVSDIGGLANLYLGLSMTAIFQLIVYGLDWARKKQKFETLLIKYRANRVRPLRPGETVKEEL